MFTWLSSFLTMPGLAVFGFLAISSPIVIHLLNKRRFKIIDWAAMEFLLDADKKNRRRVQLENLILLLLRCLAVILLGLLLARPFAQYSLSAFLIDEPKYDRVVLVDDSLSMLAQTENESAMDEAKRSLIELARGLVDNNADDMLTILRTSEPDTPLINAARVTPDSIEEIAAEIQQLEASDRSADIVKSLQALENHLASEKENVNRVVYIMTDLRERDWQLNEQSEDPNHPSKILDELSKKTSGCFLVDVGADDQSNLVVTEIKQEDTLIAGVQSQFDVTVKNLGEGPVENVSVRFTVGDAIPLEEKISRIAAGKEETVQFNFTFSTEAFEEAAFEHPGEEISNVSSVRVTAQAAASQPQREDRLLADSERFFAAHVVRGIPTVIVDGEPSADLRQSETLYLRRAVAPPGEQLFGVVADVVTDTELETTDISKYQVIFLCNVLRLSKERVAALEEWTSKPGHGLVMMLGEQVDEDAFNDDFYRDGNGLSPIKLDSLQGDVSRQKWVNFTMEANQHEIFQFSFKKDEGFTERVKIFRWWGSSLPEDLGAKKISVLARFTDSDNQPAIAEKPYGEGGRVMVFAVPADDDWSNWPPDFTFVTTMYSTVGYMAGDATSKEEFRVGSTLTEDVDLVQYRESASLRLPPDEERVNVQAVHLIGDEDDEKSKKSTVRRIKFSDANRRGFYQLNLARNNGGEDERLFAANIDPREGDLKRINSNGRQKLTSDTVSLVNGSEAASQTVRGLRREFWKLFLMLAVCCLCLEQFLGWYFGTKR